MGMVMVMGSDIFVFIVGTTFLLVIPSSASAFNITQTLDSYPYSHFNTFNTLLTRTGLTPTINNLTSYTVLVVPDDAMDRLITLSAPDERTLRNILATHVLIGYYDDEAVNQLVSKTKNSGALLDTLYGTIMKGSKIHFRNGTLLNLTLQDNHFVFETAAYAGGRISELVGWITRDQDSFAVIKVTRPIVAPGVKLDKPRLPLPPPQAPPPPSPSPSPSPSPLPPPNAAPVVPLTSTPGSPTAANSPPVPDDGNKSKGSKLGLVVVWCHAALVAFVFFCLA